MTAPLEAPPSAPGAVITASGVVVTVAAPDATGVSVEWQAAVGAPVRQTPLARVGTHWWSGELAGAGAGARYGLRASGKYVPAAGCRFNDAKLLLDPNAHALDGPVRWHRDLVIGDASAPSRVDSAALLPRCVVIDERFDWGADAAPRTPWDRTVIYEAHAKGLTMGNPAIPPQLRGTFAGLAHPATTGYLASLGVTAIQLLPVQQAGLDRAQVQRRIGNYWGYAPALFAAPDHRFASGADGRQVREFQQMVQAMHQAGIEVLLDVVFNHTLEGDAGGATLHLRGLADGRYYLRQPMTPAQYLDTTGCGHSLAAADPLARRLVLDSLRWWVAACRVDGFRFDLATTLTRGPAGVVNESPLFDEIAADPVLGKVKLIVEPWDLGPGGYSVGAFASPYVEWNDRCRHALRTFWMGHGHAGDFARRITGSDDLYARRGPLASVTYAACHDGFALRDLVRYHHPRTQANGEGGADALFAGARGTSADPDGPAPDAPSLEAERDATAAAILLSGLLGLGVPMLAQGEEVGQGRLANANAYCHDTPLVWLDWTPGAARDQWLDRVRTALATRRAWPALRRSEFWPPDLGLESVRWFDLDGKPMSADSWQAAPSTLVAELPAGRGAERLACIWRAEREEGRVALPERGREWTVVFSSGSSAVVEGAWVRVPGRAVVVLASGTDVQ